MSNGKMSNSELLYLAAANRRNKYQGAMPLQQLSPKQRRQLTTQKAQRFHQDKIKEDREKVNKAFTTHLKQIFGANHGKS